MKFNFFKSKKSLEEVGKGKKCEKCGNDEYIIKDYGFTTICIKCGAIYDN